MNDWPGFEAFLDYIAVSNKIHHGLSNAFT